MDLVSVQPAFNLYDEKWQIRGAAHRLPPAKFVFGGGDGGPKAEVYNSLVANGAIVSGAYVRDSVIGRGVRIEVGSRVEESVILDNTYVGRDVTIRRAIIDKSNNIPDNATIGVDEDFDRRHFCVSDGGVVVMAKAVPFPSM
jgi:glucose-1-phosphate adenylyltransferase